MGLKFSTRPTWGGRTVCTVKGQLKAYLDYEKSILKGEIEVPYTVEFRNALGQIVATQPSPLTPDGAPKVNLFGNGADYGCKQFKSAKGQKELKL